MEMPKVSRETATQGGDYGAVVDRSEEFGDYTVDERLMGLAAPDAVFLHCLPAYRGYEVSAEVLDGPQSVIWDEAENRLHAQKALLALLLG